MAEESSLLEIYSKPKKKFNLGSDFDKEAVFDFPYISNEDTVSYIKNHGKVMILIRGPCSTGKATLSEMLTEKYPDSAFCCADHYFKNSFNSPTRTKESLRASHEYCEMKAESACRNKTRVVIIQNTHMRKWEMQSYLNRAAQYNYTVIMAITLYRFNVSPQDLYNNSTDGLNLVYFQRRLKQWEDISPAFTGWFLCPNDALFLQSLALQSLKDLLGDGKFCHSFNVSDDDEVVNLFKAKRLSCCLAGYSRNANEMKQYYLSDLVQNLYGSCFPITILGFLVSPSGISAIVHVSDKMQLVMLDSENSCTQGGFDTLKDQMCSLGITDNMLEYSQTVAFEDKCIAVESTNASLEDWEEGENVDVSKTSFIHIGQKDDEFIEIGKIKKAFKASLCLAADNKGQICDASLTELENGIKTCRLQNDEWFVRASKKITVKALFTGLYV